MYIFNVLKLTKTSHKLVLLKSGQNNFNYYTALIYCTIYKEISLGVGVVFAIIKKLLKV